MRAILLLLIFTSVSAAQSVVYLDDLQLDGATQEWGTIQAKKSVDGNRLRVGGRSFERGVGTHANGAIVVLLDGQCLGFNAMVGVDDEKTKNASVVFRVVADGKELFNSGKLTSDDPAKQVQVDLTGVRKVELLVDDAETGSIPITPTGAMRRLRLCRTRSRSRA